MHVKYKKSEVKMALDRDGLLVMLAELGFLKWKFDSARDGCQEHGGGVTVQMPQSRTGKNITSLGVCQCCVPGTRLLSLEVGGNYLHSPVETVRLSYIHEPPNCDSVVWTGGCSCLWLGLCL